MWQKICIACNTERNLTDWFCRMEVEYSASKQRVKNPRKVMKFIISHECLTHAMEKNTNIGAPA